MLFLHQAPQVSSQVRTLRAGLLTGASAVYEMALRPVPQDLAIFMAMSRVVHGHKHRTSDERRLMLEYTTSRLFGDDSIPHGMDPALVSYTEALLFAQRVHYRKLHPFRTRLESAA